MTFLRAFIREERGAAASEFALMVPLMVVIIFTGLEAGYYMFTEHKVVKAVRDGSRYAGRLAFTQFDCSSDTINATAAQNIRNVTRTGTAVGTVPIVRGWDDNEVTVTMDCDATTTTGIFGANGTDGAPRVTVSATTTYPSLFESLVGIDGSTTVTASAQAMVGGI